MTATTTLIGNTTSDIELRYTQNGKAVGNVTIAVADRKFDRAKNEWVDGDTWFARCTLWGEVAEHAAGSLPKGTRVIAEGRIGQRDYEDRDGNRRTSVEVTVDEIGASLRYATAQVTRSQGQGGRGGASSAPAGNQPDPAWNAAQPGTQQQDVWSPTGGDYNDETPF